MQSKKHSIYESIANIFVGYIVAVLTQVTVFPFFNIEIEFKQNLLIGLIFTLVSLVRTYCLRRIFNRFVVNSSAFQGQQV